MHRVVAFTFDDGPDPYWTRRVLDVLDRHRAAATFFVVAEAVRSLPEVVEETTRRGHTIGFHCTRHIAHTDMAPGEVDEDAEHGLEILARLGIRPTLWRPPWGMVTSETLDVAERLGLDLVDWSIDPEDWKGDPAEVMEIRSGLRQIAGGVLLLHDGIGPGALRSGCGQTVRLVDRLIPILRERGVEPGPVAAAGGEPPAWLELPPEPEEVV